MAKSLPRMNSSYVNKLKSESDPTVVAQLIRDFLIETIAIGEKGSTEAIASAVRDLRSIRENIATNQIQAGNYSKNLVSMINDKIKTLDIEQGGKKSTDSLGKRFTSSIKSVIKDSLPDPSRFIDAVYEANPLVGYLPKFIKDTRSQMKSRQSLVADSIQNAKIEREAVEQEYANALLEEKEIKTEDRQLSADDLFLPILQRIDKNIELMRKEWVTIPEDMGNEVSVSVEGLERTLLKQNEENRQADERQRRLELAKVPAEDESLQSLISHNQAAQEKSKSRGLGLGLPKGGHIPGLGRITSMLSVMMAGSLLTMAVTISKGIIGTFKLAFTSVQKIFTGLSKVIVLVSKPLKSLGTLFGTGFNKLLTSSLTALGKLGTGLSSILKAIKIPGIDKIMGLGKLVSGGGLLKLFGRANPFIAWAFVLYDFIQGFTNASELSGMDEKDLNLFDKITSGLGNIVSKIADLANSVTDLLGFGEIFDTKKVYESIFNMGASIQNFFIGMYNKVVDLLPEGVAETIGLKKMSYANKMGESIDMEQTPPIPPRLLSYSETAPIVEEKENARSKQRAYRQARLEANREFERVVDEQYSPVIRPVEKVSRSLIDSQLWVEEMERISKQNKAITTDGNNNTLINAPVNTTNIIGGGVSITTSNTDSTFRRTFGK